MGFWDRLDRLSDGIFNLTGRAIQLGLLLVIVLVGLLVVLAVWAMIAA